MESCEIRSDLRWVLFTNNEGRRKKMLKYSYEADKLFIQLKGRLTEKFETLIVWHSSNTERG